jgi:hypothetical protein
MISQWILCLFRIYGVILVCNDFAVCVQPFSCDVKPGSWKKEWLISTLICKHPFLLALLHLWSNLWHVDAWKINFFLVLLLESIQKFRLLKKSAHLVLITSLEKAIWNWMDTYPNEFADLQVFNSCVCAIIPYYTVMLKLILYGMKVFMKVNCIALRL